MTATNEVILPYGSDSIPLTLSENNRFTLLQPSFRKPKMDEKLVMNIRLRSPIASDRLEDLLTSKDKLLIVVPDKTRLVRLDLVFPAIFEILKEKKIADEQVTVIFANGSHQHMTEEERMTILGKDAFSRFRHIEHDCRDAVVEKLGTTSRGTQVIINPLVKRHDKVIVISSVAHHYFAGFGGGPKMIVPGLAAWDTIWQNHRLAVLSADTPLDPGCEEGNLHNNPVYEDIIEAVKMVNVDFAVQMVLDDEGNMVDAFCGNLYSSFQKACMKASEICEVPLNGLGNIVIASAGGYPRDINLVQAHKAIHHAVRALQPNGLLIMLAECRDGFGNPNLPRWFEIQDYDEMKKAVMDNFQLNANTALALKHKLQKYTIHLVSALPSEVVTSMGFKSLEPDANEIARLAASVQERGVGYIMPNSSLTIPVLQ